MTPIVLEYFPSHWIRFSRKLNCQHPDSWSELSADQLIAAVRVMQETISDDELIASMLKLKIRLAKRLSAYQKFCIIDLLKFLDTHSPYYEFILPTIGKFARPQPRLKDEKFGTFIFAETYFEKYAATVDKAYLAKFISCYYRTGAFREADIKPNSAIIAKLPADEQEAVFLNYFLIRQWFVEQYPNVFEPAADQSKKEKSSWIDVYDAIVGDDIVKEAEYANLPISTVLRYLDKRIKTNRHEGKISRSR